MATGAAGSKPALLMRCDALLQGIRGYLAVSAVFVVVSAVTDATFMGDTIWYAAQIERGFLCESGHLLWRPLGHVLWRWLGGATRLWAGDVPLNNLVVVLVAVNWIAGLVAVAALFGIIRRLCGRPRVAFVAAVAFTCAQGFLNYSQTGSAYAASLAALLLGSWLLLRADESRRGGVVAAAAGCVLALSPALWLPFILAIPAAIASLPLLLGPDARRVRLALVAVAGCSAVLGLAYAIGLSTAGVTGVAAAWGWFAAASGGSTVGGFARMVFGFPQSLVSMSGDALLFKRLLAGDIYNPVSLRDVALGGAWKIALFYLAMVGILAQVVRGDRRWSRLAYLALAMAPVLAFAWYWKGGDMERYLALYPALFLGVAWALSESRHVPLARPVVALFVAAMVVTNVRALSKPVLGAFQARSVERLTEVLPHLDRRSTLVTVNMLDEVWQLNHNFPFHPLFRRHGEFLYALKGRDWERHLREKVSATWRSGGEVWVSERLLAPRPHASWYWVEGSHADVKWAELTAHFRALSYASAPLQRDSFVRLSRSVENERLLATMAR